MANFLIESGPAAAQTMAEADAMSSATRRKNAAYNALAEQYGPAAGDPEAQAQLQTNAQNALLDPLKLQDKQLETTEKGQAYDKSQAIQAIGTIKSLMDNGMSGQEALATVRQHAPELGLDDKHVADLAPMLDQNHDNVLGHLYDALQTVGGGSKPTGQQVMLKDPKTGQIHVGYFGQDGKLHVPTVPGGLEVLPKVTGAGTVVDDGNGGQALVKMDATGNAVTAALPGKTVQSEQTAQRIALEAAKVKIAAQRELRMKSQGGGGALTPQAVDALADIAIGNGGKITSFGNGGAALRAQIANRMAEKLGAQGQGGMAAIYAGQAAKERGTAVNDLGKQTPNSSGGKLASANALIAHTDQLSELGTALTSGNLPAINAAQQAYAKATGNPAPTNFNAVKKIAADEAVKFIVANGGGVADRQQAEAMFAGSQSPQQLQQAIQQVQHLAAGQLGGIRQRYQAIGATNDFDAHLTPRAQQVLGLGGAAPSGGQGGSPGIIHYDVHGNRVQ